MNKIADLIGIVGVVLVVLAYFFMQTGYFTKKMSLYSIINLFGSVCLLVSLWYHWNLPSVIIEVVWIAISIYGLIKSRAVAIADVETSTDNFTQ